MTGPTQAEQCHAKTSQNYFWQHSHVPHGQAGRAHDRSTAARGRNAQEQYGVSPLPKHTLHERKRLRFGHSHFESFIQNYLLLAMQWQMFGCMDLRNRLILNSQTEAHILP